MKANKLLSHRLFHTVVKMEQAAIDFGHWNWEDLSSANMVEALDRRDKSWREFRKLLSELEEMEKETP